MTDSTTPKGPLLQVTDLEVGFQTGSGLVPALRGVSLTIEHGQTVAIVGESGSGKSTTAAAIIGLLPGSGKVTGGSVLFDGKDLAKATRSELEDIRGRRIGYVPQRHTLAAAVRATAAEIVTMGRTVRTPWWAPWRIRDGASRETVRGALSVVGLADLANPASAALLARLGFADDGIVDAYGRPHRRFVRER